MGESIIKRIIESYLATWNNNYGTWVMSCYLPNEHIPGRNGGSTLKVHVLRPEPQSSSQRNVAESLPRKTEERRKLNWITTAEVNRASTTSWNRKNTSQIHITLHEGQILHKFIIFYEKCHMSTCDWGRVFCSMVIKWHSPLRCERESTSSFHCYIMKFSLKLPKWVPIRWSGLFQNLVEPSGI